MATGRRLRPCFERNALGHSIKPARQRAFSPDEARPADQNQKSGLQGILRFMGIADDSAADTKHHGAVPLHQTGESMLFTPAQEPFEQFPISQIGKSRDLAHPADIAQNILKRRAWHGSWPP